MFTLVHPVFLWALPVALGLPVMAHLLSRWGGRRVEFPTVRFVLKSVADTQRLSRPRNLLAMLLRLLTAALVVLAFASPVWHRAAAVTRGNEQHVAVLVDRSASMSRVERGATLLDRAKRDAAERVRALVAGGAWVSVIPVDADPQPLLPEPSRNAGALAAAVAALPGTQEAGRLDLALAAAEAVHRRGGQSRPPFAGAVEVELFSDLQATQAEGVSPVVMADWRLHEVGGEAGNLALDRPMVAPGGPGGPGVPVAGGPVTLSVRVTNHADEPTDATVRLRLSEGEATRRVKLDARRSATLSFDVAAPPAGAWVVRLELVDPRDALPLDDAVELPVRVRAARPVAVWTAADPDDPATGTYYLTRALHPHPHPHADAEGSEASRIELSINPPTLPPDAALVIVEAGGLTAAQAATLRQHLQGGGGVLWIVDSPGAAAAAAAQASDLAPLRPASSPQPVTLAAARFDDAMLTRFDGPARAALLRTRFSHAFPGPLLKDAEPLLLGETDQAVMAGRRVEMGRLVMLAASLDPASTDWPRRPTFPAFLHEVVRHLTPDPPPPPPLHPGDLLPLQPPVLTPDGSRSASRLAQTVGVYREAEGEATVGVWIDPRESDLRVFDSIDSATHETAVGSIEREPVERREGVPLWPWCAAGALLLVAVEPVVLSGGYQTLRSPSRASASAWGGG